VVYRQSVRLGTKPLETHDQCFFNWTLAVDERMGLSFTIAAGPLQLSHSQVRVPRDSWPHFTLSNSTVPKPGGQVPVFISPRNRVARLYPQALGSLFFTSCDSQSCGGDIRPRLHGINCLHGSLYRLARISGNPLSRKRAYWNVRY
jgi:hypothetical protein